MEKNGHVVLVVRGIEARDVDKRTGLAFSKLLCIQRWSSVVVQIHCSVVSCVLDPCCVLLSRDLGSQREHCRQDKPYLRPGTTWLIVDAHHGGVDRSTTKLKERRLA